METHWQDKFNINEIADFVHLSKYHFARIFKKHTGMKPYGYYQDIKFGKLKEKLLDNNLSIAEAFAGCGMDYKGYFAKIFKEKVGITPLQYRASALKE
jgi:AraC-like DNA-binding protein